MRQRARHQRGFTLVELMIVVAIIGILAAIAIPNFLNFRMKAKTAEARSNLGAIRGLEVAYFAEWNFYVCGALYNPRLPTVLDGSKADWNPNTTFSVIGFAPEGKVYYTYTLLNPATIWGQKTFSAVAQADLDKDGQISLYTLNDKTSEVRHGGGDF